MNLRKPNANEAIGTFNRSRNVAPVSGICTRCVDGCRGGCDIWLSSFRGREALYPGPFGEVTAGADKEYPLDYSHLNIQGYAVGAKGLPEGIEGNPDTAVFHSVDTETEILIQDALEKLMADRTTIVIAHRLSTIQKADRIIVMHKGEIRESGTHQELLAMRGFYYRLYLLQYQAQEGGTA